MSQKGVGGESRKTQASGRRGGARFRWIPSGREVSIILGLTKTRVTKGAMGVLITLAGYGISPPLPSKLLKAVSHLWSL